MKRILFVLQLFLASVALASPQTEDLNMQEHQIKRLAPATTPSDAVRLDQIPTPLPTSTPPNTPVPTATAVNTAVATATAIATPTVAPTGMVAHTGSNVYAGRVMGAPAAGLTWSNANGVLGNPTLALANDLSALEAMSGTGLVCRTASETYAQRSLSQPAAGITITNPAGIAGDPTFALANDLSAVEGISSTGIAVRTGTDTWTVRALATPSAGLTITNPGGIAGNPTFALADDLAGIEAITGTAIVVRDAVGSFIVRTLTGTTNEIDVTNGSGVVGNPTLSLPAFTTWSYTPVASAGSCTASTLHHARYVRRGKLLCGSTAFACTPSGASGNVAITLPVATANISASSVQTAVGACTRGGATLSCFMILNNNSTTATIRFYDASNWTSGVSNEAFISFCYESA